MLENAVKNMVDSINELQEQLYAFQAFVGAYMVSIKENRLVAPPPSDMARLDKFQLILKTEEVDGKRSLVAELVVKEVRSH
jgi:hypothetical protein